MILLVSTCSDFYLHLIWYPVQCYKINVFVSTFFLWLVNYQKYFSKITNEMGILWQGIQSVIFFRNCENILIYYYSFPACLGEHVNLLVPVVIARRDRYNKKYRVAICLRPFSYLKKVAFAQQRNVTDLFNQQIMSEFDTTRLKTTVKIFYWSKINL